jgi:hypothetical protein
MQCETLKYEGRLEESVTAWSYRLVKLVDDRFCKMLEQNVYIPPSDEERDLGYCPSSVTKAGDDLDSSGKNSKVHPVFSDSASLTYCRAQVPNSADFVPNDSNAFDWLVIPHPLWFFTDNSKEELEKVRDRMTSPSKLTIAVELDGLWFLARVERVDRRAHDISWGGDGGEWTKLRLVGYAHEELHRFVFLVQRNGLDQTDGMICKVLSPIVPLNNFAY